MTAQEFNVKWGAFLEEGHYGLDLHKPEVIEYLDREFEELSLLPGFKYSQIKSKFHWFCFYAEGVSNDKIFEIENKIKQLYDGPKNVS